MLCLEFFFVNTVAIASIPWNYDPTSGDGPDSWAQRSIECNNESVCHPYPYQDCAGQAQSPLNIIDEATESRESAFLHLWRSVNSTGPQHDKIYNNGHDIIIDVLSSQLQLTSSMFSDQLVLVSIIHKLPAEHTINGVRHDIEQQLVFRPADAASSNDKSWTNFVPEVRISLLYTKVNDPLPTSDPPTVLSQIMSHFPRLSATGDTLYLFRFIPWLDLTHDTVYVYEGSNTVPPCNEKVTWIISDRIRMTDADQVDTLHRGLRTVAPQPYGNARPEMPLHGRKVFKRSLKGPSKKRTFVELEMRTNINKDAKGSISNGTIIRSSPASHSSRYKQSLEDAVVGLAIVLVFLVCGLSVAALLRTGIIPLTIIPAWLGGIAEPARERWTTSSKEIFGLYVPDQSGGDIEDELGEELEEDEEEEDEEDEEEEEEER